jgi:glycosyltransferase involved in cell wall biosynthesis
VQKTVSVVPGATRVGSSGLEGEVALAVLLPTDIVGGHEHMLFEWLPRAHQMGLRLTVYGGANRQLVELARKVGIPWRDAGYRVDRRDLLRRAQWGNFVRTLWTAVRLPSRTPVLLAPGAMQIGLLHVLACRLARRRIICYVPITQSAATLRMRRPGLRDWLTTRLARSVSMWITITDEHARRLTDFWKIRAPVHVIPNRVAALSRPAAPPRALLRDTGPVRLLFAGRLEPIQKGLDWLVDALDTNESWMADLRIEFQGAGPFVAHLEAFARRAAPDRVKVLPWGNIEEAFARADVLLLASRFEGLPLVAIEALWAGVPVIATVESGLADVLPQGSLYPFGDLAALRAAIERMRAPDNREAAVVHARDRLHVLLDEKRYQRALADVTEDVAMVTRRA